MEPGVISTRLELEGRDRALPCHTSLQGACRELECPNVTNQPQKRWGRNILETSSNLLKTMRNYIVLTSSLTPTHLPLSRCLYLSLQWFPLQLLLCAYTEWVDGFVRWARTEKASNPVGVRTSQGFWDCALISVPHLAAEFRMMWWWELCECILSTGTVQCLYTVLWGRWPYMGADRLDGVINGWLCVGRWAVSIHRWVRSSAHTAEAAL